MKKLFWLMVLIVIAFFIVMSPYRLKQRIAGHKVLQSTENSYGLYGR